MQENPRKFIRKKVLIPIILLTIGILAGLHLYIKSLQYQSTDDAFIDGNIVQISPKISGYVKKIYIKDNQKVNKGDLLLEIDPADFQIQVERAKAAMESAMAKNKGADINVTLTDITSNALLKQASSGLSFAQSQELVSSTQIDVAKSSFEQAEAKIAETKADLQQTVSEAGVAEATVSQANKDLIRFKHLNKEGAISAQEYENALTNYRIANARLKAAQDKILAQKALLNSAVYGKNSAQKMVTQKQAEYNQSLAQIGQAQGQLEQVNTKPQNLGISKANAGTNYAEVKKLAAELKQAKLDLVHTKIYAPESGYITKKNIENGSYIQKAQALMAIVPANTWIIANFKENQLEKIKPNQNVKITVDAYPHKVFKGRVDSIQRGTGSRFSLLPPENAVGSYVKVVQRIPVKIVFDEKLDSKYILVPGMSVVPEVEVK